LEVLKRQPKQVALTALLRMPEQAPGYIVGAFIFTYATTVLGMQRNFVLVAVLVQAVLGFLWVPVAGHVSDRIGRRRMLRDRVHPGRIAAARAAADRSAARWRNGRPLSSIDGMPLGIKDIIETADMPTEQGSPLFVGWRTGRDGPPASRRFTRLVR
jgi:hypothetical protein